MAIWCFCSNESQGQGGEEEEKRRAFPPSSIDILRNYGLTLIVLKSRPVRG